jgi:hypothetical protein
MKIRQFELGDEIAQVEIYNAETAHLPAFKPATVAEVTRRYGANNPDARTRLYAIENGAVVAYANCSPNGRISYPWGAAEAREPLLEAVVKALKDQGAREAWVAYRADWSDVLEFFKTHGFRMSREIVNYVTEVSQLPRAQPRENQAIRSVGKGELGEILHSVTAAFGAQDAAALAQGFSDNPYLDASALFALWERGRAALLGLGLTVIRTGYADPTKIDPAMPCFRLGTFGTERERHKRVNGLVSFLFGEQQAGEALLAEAARRLEAAGLPHAAAQAPSDQPELCAFYDKHFKRQGSFPILVRPL